MTLGLPGHLASVVVNEGIARGMRTVAAIGLCGALAVCFLLLPAATPVHALMAFTSLAAMGASLILLARRTSASAALVYLCTGAATIVAVSEATTDMPVQWAVPAISVVHLVTISVVMVGGVDSPHVSGIVWTVGAVVLVTVADLAAALLLGIPPVVPWMAWCAAAVNLTIYAVVGSRRVRRVRLVQPDIHRAARDEKVAEVRSCVERRAAALLHDTILGSLSAVAGGPVGPIDPAVARVIERDLDAILGQDWMEAGAPVAESAPDRVLGSVIAEVEDLGLEVIRTGDAKLLERLPPRGAHALALAVKQVLVNVHRHAGVASAEVMVVGYPDSVTVMVIDSGVGFDPAAVGTDRIGLRTSVVDRVEDVGGDVRLWSTPGRGTSVLISLPVPEVRSHAGEPNWEADVDGIEIPGGDVRAHPVGGARR